MEKLKGLMCHPTVCAVNDNYQIMIPVEYDMLISVRVGENIYYNHSNGIRISSQRVQRISVPAIELDKHKKYTVICQKMIERKPYRPVTEPEYELEYNFKPIEKTEDINIYHLADVHGEEDGAVGSAQFLNKEIDLLIMNGDLAEYSDSIEDVTIAYRMASRITKGEVPCIISRGNHDLRGALAEHLADFMPNDNGNSYFTFKVGCIWGILVDCGEDKVDDNIEYGNTICCHQFRVEQEKFINKVIENAKDHYEKDDIKYRLVISHVPFSFKMESPFDIEKDMYARWGSVIKENIKPDLMLCGHIHKPLVSYIGSEHDELGQPCTVISGSDNKWINETTKLHTGMYMNLNPGVAKLIFNTKDKIVGEEIVEF